MRCMVLYLASGRNNIETSGEAGGLGEEVLSRDADGFLSTCFHTDNECG